MELPTLPTMLFLGYLVTIYVEEWKKTISVFSSL